MATKDIQKRRKVRELEAKRDKLMEQQAAAKVRLAETRAALKATRAKR